MSKHHRLLRFSILLCWMLLTLGLGMVGQHTVAHAAPLPDGYALTITESTSTMTYGGTAPTFQAHLTVPDGDNPLQSPSQVFFTIESQSFAPDGNTSNGSTSYTFTLNGTSVAAQSTLSVGEHTAVARYFSSVLDAQIQSEPITFTVQKRTPTLVCGINIVGIFAANAPVKFTIGAQSGPAIDWQNATASVTFVGTQTMTESNLTIDGFGDGTVLTPPVPGQYKYQCAFSGTDTFNAAQTALSKETLVVTQGHQPVIKLYSNPTTIEAGQTVTMEIVIAGGSGLPTPTGSVALHLGPYYYTKLFNLGSQGSLTLQILFPSPLPSPTLQVYYYGDSVYAESSADFPLTNPPIPGGSNPNPTPAPISTSTPSPLTPTPSGGSTPVPSSTATSSSTPTSTSTTTANGGQTFDNPPTISTPNQGSPLVFWMVVLGLLALAGGSGVFIVLRNRARAAPRRAMATVPPSEDD